MFAIKYERQRKKYLHRLKHIKYHLGPPPPPKKDLFQISESLTYPDDWTLERKSPDN